MAILCNCKDRRSLTRIMCSCKGRMIVIGAEVEVEVHLSPKHSLLIPHGKAEAQGGGRSMSVHREVVSLSQLLRRSENSNPRRGGPGHALPLPLQTSRRRTETSLSSGHKSVHVRQQTNSAPFTERPASSRYPPLFTQCVRDTTSRTSTSQPESSQIVSGFPALSQEAYEGESVQLSAMTSMSQSSLCPTQSQNLLGSSQDDQLHRLQQWQTQQASSSFPSSPIRCNGSEKLHEMEQNLSKAFVDQTHEQKQQQEHLMMQFATPITESINEIKTKLENCGQGQQKQEAVIEVLAEGIGNVTATVAELHEQSRSNKAVYEDIRTAVVTEAEAVKAVLTSLQARVDSVEGSVKSCSSQAAQVLQVVGTKHEILLSAVVASSCNCPKATTPVEALSSTEKPIQKRRSSLYQPDVADNSPSRDGFTAVTRSPVRSSAQSPTQDDSLHLALQRIEALRAKRRSYLRQC